MKRNTIIIVTVGIALTLAIGYTLGRGGIRFERAGRAAPSTGQPVLDLGDFESAGEVGRREAKGVVVTQSQENVTHGRSSLKLTYRNNVEAPAFRLEKWFYKERKAQNWSGYEALAFNLYNPQDSQLRFILQIKDKEGSRYKENLYIGSHKTLEWRGAPAPVSG